MLLEPILLLGHLGESDEVWREAVERLKLLPLTHIHLFSYSQRDGTKSATMKLEKPTGNIVKLRQKEVNEIVERKNLTFRKKYNRDLQVLVENQIDKNQFYRF